MTRLRSASGPVRVRVPAKINLYLACDDIRRDGYHELVTVFSSVDLCDEVVITSAPRPAVTTTGVGAALVPGGSKNLASAAARLLAKRTKSGGPVAIEIRKQIPVAGGMAGGSADAAATLVGCAALWGLDLTRDQLADVATELGADVPFLLTGGTAIGTGRGDRLAPVLARTPLHWVLAFSSTGLSTPEVFAELDRLRDPANPNGAPPRVGDVQDVLAALSSGDPARVADVLANDLQPAALSLRPDLRRTLRAGVAAGALGGVVSGSGPTVALLCADAESAADVAAEMSGSGTVRSVRIAAGPVPGARVVD